MSDEPRWTRVHSVDEMEAFYKDALPRIREAARALGYAIGVHGSMRRDLDLIAVPWIAEHADKDTLAQAVMKSAGGFQYERDSHRWTQKPCGRVAISLPICWCEWEGRDYNVPGIGHIDLSVMPAAETDLAAFLDSIHQATELVRAIARTADPEAEGTETVKTDIGTGDA